METRISKMIDLLVDPEMYRYFIDTCRDRTTGEYKRGGIIYHEISGIEIEANIKQDPVIDDENGYIFICTDYCLDSYDGSIQFTACDAKVRLNQRSKKCMVWCPKLVILNSSRTNGPSHFVLYDFNTKTDDPHLSWSRLSYPALFEEKSVYSGVDPFGEKFFLDPQDELEYLTVCQ